MTQVELHTTENGFLVSGPIRFGNVVLLRHQGDRLLRQIKESNIQVDLSGVQSSDASALTLLLRWVHSARTLDKRIQFLKVPSSLVNVACICGVKDLLGI